MKKHFLILLACLALVPSGDAQSLAPLHAELEKKWPGNRTIHLVFHGHSVPAGYHKTPEVRPFESYPHLVHRMLKQQYPHAVINVMTTAIGGENAVSGAARFKKDVLSLRPDIIFIDYALNDRRLPLDQVERAWMDMIREAKQAGVPLVLLTPTGDENADMADPNDPLNQRAELIRTLAGREKIILADVSAAWIAELKNGVPQKDLLSQRNHPNLKGHQLAADVIFTAFGRDAFAYGHAVCASRISSAATSGRGIPTRPGAGGANGKPAKSAHSHSPRTDLSEKGPCLAQAAAITVSVEKSPWTWHRMEGESLALHGPQGLLWRLNFGPDLAKPFFDPLATPGGGSLTWVAPPDHVWHYGLWFSWKTINGVNYWETNSATGKPDGTTRLTKATILRTDDSGVELIFDFVFHPAAGGDPVMKESVRLSIETPRPDGSYRIDWHQKTTATGPVVLDRTPLPDQPGGKPWGGYGGLSFRAAKDLTDVLILDSEGRRGMDTHRRRAHWLDTSGTVAGKPAGVTFFDHPANPRHPTTWYVALSPFKEGPFTYMNPALLHDESIKLGAGESLALRYRILVHPGAADPRALDAEFEEFSR